MKHIYDLRFWAIGGWFTWIAIAIGGSTLIGAGTSLIEANQTKKALQGAQGIVSGLSYQPIDIAALQKSATEASVNDAINSLALQRQLQPNVVRSNEALQKSVADQLAMGGNLPPDIANAVASAARTSNGISGATGNAAPATAALIGQTSLGLLQQRQQAAEQLAATNPAPSVGLSAQDIASATEANSNAVNQFNLAKAGANTSLLNSGAQANAAAVGGVGSSLAQALTLMSLMGGKTGTAPQTVQPPASFSTPAGGYGIPSGSNLTFATAPSVTPG